MIGHLSAPEPEGRNSMGFAGARLRLSLMAAVMVALGGLIETATSASAQTLDLTDYDLAYAAEFRGPDGPAGRSLQTRKVGALATRFETWGGLRTLPGNGELQLYVDPNFAPSPFGVNAQGFADASPEAGVAPLGLDPFRIETGALVISATRTPAALEKVVDRPYVSGLVTTEPSFTQRYGYFETRAKLAAGRGLWPAFWLVSLTHAEHFEIDVFEMLGHEPMTIYQSTHRGDHGVHLRRDLGFDTSSDWHRYGVKWTPQMLAWYVDGKETARTDGAMFRDAPPMYMLANLSVGGNWPGNPDASTPFPAEMRIEYLRAYRHRCSAGIAECG